jgi:hypothetical protein
MSFTTLLAVAGLFLSLCALAAAISAARAVRGWRARCESLELSFAALGRELELVASISVRTGRRVKRIENDYSGVADRVDVVESRGAAGALDQAIDWARRGADPSQLTQQLGLSRGEADLVARLHGRTKTA